MPPWGEESAEETQKNERQKWAKYLSSSLIIHPESPSFLSPAPPLAVFSSLRPSRILPSNRRHLDTKKRTKHSWRPKVNTPSTTMRSLTVDGTKSRLYGHGSVLNQCFWGGEKMGLFFTRQFTGSWWVRRGLPVGHLWLGRALGQVLGLEVSHRSGSSCRRVWRMTTQQQDSQNIVGCEMFGCSDPSPTPTATTVHAGVNNNKHTHTHINRTDQHFCLVLNPRLLKSYSQSVDYILHYIWQFLMQMDHEHVRSCGEERQPESGVCRIDNL